MMAQRGDLKWKERHLEEFVIMLQVRNTLLLIIPGRVQRCLACLQCTVYTGLTFQTEKCSTYCQVHFFQRSRANCLKQHGCPSVFFEIVNYAILHQETRCGGEGKHRNIKNSLSSLSCLDIIWYGAELLKHCVTFLRGPYSLQKRTMKKIFWL